MTKTEVHVKHLHIVVTHEMAREARECMARTEDESTRCFLERFANCYPAPEEPTLPMEGE